MWGAQCLLEVRRRFWVGSGRPSMLMLGERRWVLLKIPRGDIDIDGVGEGK